MRLSRHHSWFTHVVFGHIALAFALSFVIGFEREIRGAPAGDRTYALVGTGAAAITTVTVVSSPQAIAGIVTGIGHSDVRLHPDLRFDGGRALTTDARRITAVCTQLDADPQQRTVVARLHHLPFQRRVRDGTDSSQCPLDLVHLEVLALTGEQI